MALSMAVSLALVGAIHSATHGQSEAHGPLTHHEIESPRTVYAIGDLHGDCDCAFEWIRHLKLVEFSGRDRDEWQWIGGNDTVLVFVGDYIDRGPQSLDVVNLVRNLTVRFPERVVAILGNHEVYLLGDIEQRRHDTEKMRKRLFLDHSYAVVHPAEFGNHLQESKEEILFSDVAKVALETFYKGHMEESLAIGLVKRALDHFSGREEELITKVEKKYEQKVDVDLARQQLEAKPGQAESHFAKLGFTPNDTKETLPALYRALDRIYSKNKEASVFFGGGSGQPADGYVSHYVTLPSDTAEAALPASHYKRRLAVDALQRRVAVRMAEWQEAYMESFAPDTELGRWLQSRPLATIAGRTLFVHGGIGRRFLPPLHPNNNNIEHALSQFNSALDFERTDADADADTERFQREQYRPRPLYYSSQANQPQQALGFLTINDLVTYRGMHRGNGLRGSSGCEDVGAVLARVPSADRVAVGHTADFNVRFNCDDTLLCVDSTLGKWFHLYGNRYCPGTGTQTPRRCDNYHCDCSVPLDGKCRGQVLKLQWEEEPESDDGENSTRQGQWHPYKESIEDEVFHPSLNRLRKMHQQKAAAEASTLGKVAEALGLFHKPKSDL